MQVCWDAAGEVIKAWCTEGHSVAVPGLGTMRFGVRAKSVPTVGEVATSLITNRRVIFTPSVDIKRELQETSIQITCYDRNGKVVKNVTSDDKGDVEDPDNNPGGGGSDNTRAAEILKAAEPPAVMRETVWSKRTPRKTEQESLILPQQEKEPLMQGNEHRGFILLHYRVMDVQSCITRM